MKARRIELYSWDNLNNADGIEIDWPNVQRTIGLDHLGWLLKQKETECQLVVDKINENCKLMAEFYSESTAVDYYLRWAK